MVRPCEEGAAVVASAPGSVTVVLQMPRGRGFSTFSQLSFKSLCRGVPLKPFNVCPSHHFLSSSTEAAGVFLLLLYHQSQETMA